MKPTKFKSIVSIFFLLVLQAGCGSSGSDAPVFVPPPPPPPPPPSFNQFVVDQFATTADDTDPVAVDDEDFAFEEDPSAFDSVLQ